MIIAPARPRADGPIGDSALVVSDGRDNGFQHERRPGPPFELDALASEFGHIDVHLLQYSGAIWYPMVYDMPARAQRGVRHPEAAAADGPGPPIHRPGRGDLGGAVGRATMLFWTPSCENLNDDHGDPANIFPDQIVFLDQMRAPRPRW